MVKRRGCDIILIAPVGMVHINAPVGMVHINAPVVGMVHINASMDCTCGLHLWIIRTVLMGVARTFRGREFERERATNQ
jgi:hypothetical protein